MRIFSRTAMIGAIILGASQTWAASNRSELILGKVHIATLGSCGGTVRMRTNEYGRGIMHVVLEFGNVEGCTEVYYKGKPLGQLGFNQGYFGTVVLGDNVGNERVVELTLRNEAGDISQVISVDRLK